MELAETNLTCTTDICYVPHLDRLTLAFTTIDKIHGTGVHQWDFRFPVQMTAEEARELAAELLDFANCDTDEPTGCANCGLDITKKT